MHAYENTYKMPGTAWTGKEVKHTKDTAFSGYARSGIYTSGARSADRERRFLTGRRVGSVNARCLDVDLQGLCSVLVESILRVDFLYTL